MIPFQAPMRPYMPIGFLFALFCLSPFSLFSQDKVDVVIGIVLDGDSARLQEENMPLMKREILALLERDYDVSFPEEKTLNGEWQTMKIADHFNVLLEDDDVDLVLCLGVLATLEAGRRGPLPKPVVAPYGISADMPIYPVKNGASGILNFNYMSAPSRFKQDLDLLKKIKPVKKVHLLTSGVIAREVTGIQDWVTGVFKERGMEVSFVMVGALAQEALDGLPADTEMVYVTPLLQFNDMEKNKLYEGLKARRLPSVSMLGADEVSMGALAGLAPESDVLRWFRRVALNIQRILQGEDAGTLSTILEGESKLTLNMATARAIDWFPSWDLQISARLLNEDPEEIDRKLTLAETIYEALEVNLSYQAAKKEVEAAAMIVTQTRGQRKPQVKAVATGLQVDADTADSSLGSQAETTLSGSLTVDQVLFSEELNAGVTIQEYLQRAREKELEAFRLDLAEDAAARFLNYLKAQTGLRVQRNNLDLTSSNLETARIREKVGISGPSEVYRWESQMAGDRQRAITAQAQSDSALAALNQVLHYTQEGQLIAIAPKLIDARYITGRGRLEPYVRNAKAFEIFRGFMVAEGLKNAPELAQLDALIAAQKRDVLAGKRSYYTPTVGLRGSLNHTFSRSGSGSSSLTFPGFTFPERKDTGWNVALNFSLPLYSGGVRKAALAQSRITADQLSLQRRATAEQIELRIRVSLQNVGATSVNIDLTRVAAEAARKNYELVQKSYATGVASSIDLLDAQNASLAAELGASNAIYDFLLELMSFQRAAANFDFFRTPEQSDQFFKRLEEFYERAR